MIWLRRGSAGLPSRWWICSQTLSEREGFLGQARAQKEETVAGGLHNSTAMCRRLDWCCGVPPLRRWMNLFRGGKNGSFLLTVVGVVGHMGAIGCLFACDTIKRDQESTCSFASQSTVIFLPLLCEGSVRFLLRHQAPKAGPPLMPRMICGAPFCRCRNARDNRGSRRFWSSPHGHVIARARIGARETVPWRTSHAIAFVKS